MSRRLNGKTVPCDQCGKPHYRPASYLKKKRYFCGVDCMIAANGGSRDPVEAFWLKVEKKGAADCWLWIGSRKPRGYGHMLVRGKDYNAHRFSYELANGPIPPGMEVMHTCDTPPCVNPAHLRLGSHGDNMRDSQKKMRHVYGERNQHAKLTESQVIEIRRDFIRGKRAVGGGNGNELAAKYGVSVSAIEAAAYGRSWRHL